MIQGLLNILNWHPLSLAGLTFGLVILLVFELTYLRHRSKNNPGVGFIKHSWWPVWSPVSPWG